MMIVERKRGKMVRRMITVGMLMVGGLLLLVRKGLTVLVAEAGGVIEVEGIVVGPRVTGI